MTGRWIVAAIGVLLLARNASSETTFEDAIRSWIDERSEGALVEMTLPTPESAQTDAPPPAIARNRPYVFGGFSGGQCNHDVTVYGGGGGGEGFPWKRLGIGGEGGYFSFVDDVSFGLASANIAVHIGESPRVDPFFLVSPGFYFSEDQGGGAFGLGGGVNVWFLDRVGFRADLRYQALGTEEGLVLFRAGVTFR